MKLILILAVVLLMLKLLKATVKLMVAASAIAAIVYLVLQFL